MMRPIAFVGVLLVTLIGAPSARAGSAFLDLTAVTPGTSGTFAGSLNGVGVTGAITANDGSYQWTLTGLASWDNSVTNNTSPQYSYSNIYTPSIPLTDQVGYDKFFSTGSATVTITFGSAVTDPVFHVANLDASEDTFSLTGGLTGLHLLSGNGGGGDGLGVSGNTVLDLNPDTAVGQDPSTPPLTSGPRSAYGSVELLGTISTLTFNVSYPGLPPGDGGSFTLSTSAVPEPSSLALFCVAGGLGGIGFLWWRRRRGRKAS
jgi:PEP-CTERM motif